MTRLLHRIAHLLGWNRGRVVSGIECNRIMIGFQCDSCGEIADWHAAQELGDALAGGKDE